MTLELPSRDDPFGGLGTLTRGLEAVRYHLIPEFTKAEGIWCQY